MCNLFFFSGACVNRLEQPWQKVTEAAQLRLEIIILTYLFVIRRVCIISLQVRCLYLQNMSQTCFLYSQLYNYFWFLKNGRPHIKCVQFTWFRCKYPQIKAESLHFLSVSFQVHCGCVQSQNDDSCVNVPIYGPNCKKISSIWWKHISLINSLSVCSDAALKRKSFLLNENKDRFVFRAGPKYSDLCLLGRNLTYRNM